MPTIPHSGFLFSLCVLLSEVLVISCTDILSFHGEHQEALSCNKIKISGDVGCICVTGLWRFYSDCSSFYSLAGDSYCFNQLPKVISSVSSKLKDVSFAVELLPSQDSIALIRKDSVIVRLTGHQELSKTLNLLEEEDLFVTGRPHTIHGPRGIVCFSPQENAYCTYRQPMDFVGGSIQNITAGCEEDIPYIAPIFCDFIKEPQLCKEIPYVKDESLNEIGEPGEKRNSPAVRVKRRVGGRRDHRAGHHGRSMGGKHPLMRMGRTFLGAPGQMFERVGDDLPEEDEDFLEPELLKNMTEFGGHDSVLSEIWNYVETQAEIVMGLKKPMETEIDYDLPYFKLLHISKKVMQAICPPTYVTPGFFDIAVQAFIQVQVKRLAYDPPNANWPGFLRIKVALEDCLKNATAFPFLTPETVNASMACDPKAIGQGQFVMFNHTEMDLTISESFVGLNKDPIIETVWKIFYAAHSRCFPFFSHPESSFNDHHRYTAWLTPLFKNKISEVWSTGTASSFTYGKFLGDLEEVMTKVAYCAASSRFSEIKLDYPWELPRPTPSEPPGPEPARKKRSVTSPLATCLDTRSAEFCFSNSKRLTSTSRLTTFKGRQKSNSLRQRSEAN